MFTVEFTKEEREQIEAARAAKASRAEERNAAAQAAYKKALADVGYDVMQLVVYPMPDALGGAVIYKLPSFEAWALASKRLLRAIATDGKKDDSAAAIAGLVEHHALLVHPPLPELQQWRNELPDLYSEIHNTMDARCSHGQATGK